MKDKRATFNDLECDIAGDGCCDVSVADTFSFPPDALPLDYATIRAQRLQAEDVCGISGCTEPVLARYGHEVFNGAGIEFVVTERLCARHNTARDTRFVIERT